ncbi:MAG TPA: GFA family protein [Kofleriaceae bacterium]
MSDWKLPWNGGCRCDRTRLRITAPPIVTMACHCAGCQRMTASAFSLSIFMPSAGFEVTQGAPVIGGIHGPDRHFHCDYCKSWLFTRPNGMDAFVNMRATMLDDHAWYAPFVETSTSEALPWAKTGARHSFPNIPPPEAFGPIVAEFAQHGARPS